MYAPQPVKYAGHKMLRVQNAYNHKLDSYRTAVYEIRKSQYTGKNPALKYPKMPTECKDFLLGDYGTKYKPKYADKAWTIYMPGDLLYEGTKAGFDTWFQGLGPCDVCEEDESD